MATILNEIKPSLTKANLSNICTVTTVSCISKTTLNIETGQ